MRQLINSTKEQRQPRLGLGETNRRFKFQKTSQFFRPHAQRSAFRRRIARQRSRSSERFTRVPETQPAFHPRAQRNAYRRRDVRPQSRLFARWNQSLRRSPGSVRGSRQRMTKYTHGDPISR